MTTPQYDLHTYHSRTLETVTEAELDALIAAYETQEAQAEYARRVADAWARVCGEAPQRRVVDASES